MFGAKKPKSLRQSAPDRLKPALFGVDLPWGRSDKEQVSEITKHIQLAQTPKELMRFQGKAFFHQSELTMILKLYKVMQAKGHWRDYALDHENNNAVFSLYRTPHDAPEVVIEKQPAKNAPPLFNVFWHQKHIVKKGTFHQAFSRLQMHVMSVR